MNFKYDIVENFDEGWATAEFKIKSIIQTHEDEKKYEAIIFYEVTGHKYDGNLIIESSKLISLDEIYLKWCKNCEEVLRKNGNIDWWYYEFDYETTDARYKEIDKIIEEKYHANK